MKICFLTPEYPHVKTGKSGGIGTSIMNLSLEFVRNGHPVSIIVYGQNEDEVFEDDGITFYKVKNIKLSGASWLMTRLKIQRLINRLWTAGRIEIVEAPDWTGIISFMNLHCPVVIKLHGSDTYFCHLDNRPVKTINKIHERKSLKNADGIIAVSDYTGELTNRLFDLHLNYTVIPNGIDLSLFMPDTSVLVNANTILYFGSLIRKKGIFELARIFNLIYEENHQAQLILVGKDVSDIISGQPSSWKIMQSLFSEASFRNVYYIGPVEYLEIKNHILAAAVCVFPTFAEALPVSWIEAMALKKAIVASNVGWAKEMIDDGVNGYLASPTDHQMFATRIQTLLNEPLKAKSFGNEARRRVESCFDIREVAASHLKFYQTIINGNRN